MEKDQVISEIEWIQSQDRHNYRYVLLINCTFNTQSLFTFQILDKIKGPPQDFTNAEVRIH